MKHHLNTADLLNVLDPSNGSKELIKVVRSLLNFIVLEGKEHVEQNKREEYVKKYLFTLTKATNGLSNYVDMDKVKKQILIDINNSFK
jgi:hypothetical protein